MDAKTQFNRVASAGRHTLDGTIRVFLAESLILPTGLVTLAFLTRRLGATDYGLFALAAAAITWIEWSLTTMFARAVNKCVSEAADWQPVATTVLRLHLFTSVAVAVLLMMVAGPVATGLGEPALADYLRLFALDIPLFSLAHAHRNILIGIGDYRQRAWLSAGRWLARLVLIVLLVGVGWSIHGAIVAIIGASVVELVMARRFIRPSLWRPSGFPVRRLLLSALPLLVLGVCLRLLGKGDLFILKALGATAAQAGLYGAAQNLAVVPGLFAQAFSPLLLSTLTRLRRDGRLQQARSMARDSIRLVILLLPFAALAAGAAPEIVRLVAGAQFTGASVLVQWLIFAALAFVLISVATVILVAADRSWWAVAVAGPMVLIALVGQFWAIPHWGARGAAMVTTVCAWLGALIAVGLVAADWRVAPPRWSVIRSVAVSGAAYALAQWWPAPGWLVMVKLAVLVVTVLVAYFLLGEFDARERALAWSLMPWRKAGGAR